MGLIYYNISTVGDCSNTSSGSFSLSVSGDSPPFNITWISPISGLTFSSQTITTNPYVVNSLSAGTYAFQLTDSSLLTSASTVIGSVSIVSSTTINLGVFKDTTCGQNNGIITANTPTNFISNTVSLFKDGELYETQSGGGTIFSFINLGPGIYYSNVESEGGCVGTSDSVIIHGSETLDFELYVINNPACLLNNGKIYVTGLTGTPPFTYEWSTNVPSGQTSYFVTGLTRNNYSVTVTDYYGCSLTKGVFVDNASPISLVNYSVVQPTCLQSDGSITFTISGGSAPYYYLLSNGYGVVSYSEQITFSGLSSGLYELNVTDVSLCTFKTNARLSTPNTFSVVSITSENSKCGYKNGSVTVQLNGGAPPYLMSLINSQGTEINISSTLTNTTFNSLSSDTYTLLIRDSFSACTYSGSTVITNNPSYDFSVNSTGTTCGNNDGIIQISIISASTTGNSYTYSLSNGSSSVDTTATTYTFTGVSAGNYEISVVNSEQCKQLDYAVVSNSEPYSIFMYPSTCYRGTDGTIQVLIEESDGPFNLTWSDNVNGQTGMYITGLTAGTYYLTVSGETGCQQLLSTDIVCVPSTSTTYSFTYGSGVREYSPSSKLSLKNMLYSGYSSLVTDAEYCKLNSAEFSLKVTIDSTDYTFPFYYTTTFDRIPTLSYFSGILENAILSIPYITDCTVDAVNGSIEIESEVVGGVEYYKDETITFDILIDYDISCLSINDIVCP